MSDKKPDKPPYLAFALFIGVPVAAILLYAITSSHKMSGYDWQQYGFGLILAIIAILAINFYDR